MKITYLQVKEIKKYLAKIKVLEDGDCCGEELYNFVRNLNSRISSSLDEYNPQGIDWDSPKSYVQYDYEDYIVQYDDEKIQNILSIMKATLTGILIKHEEVAQIIVFSDLVEEGQLLKDSGNEDNCEEFIRRVISVYPEAFSDEQRQYLINTFNKSVSNIVQVIASLEHYINILSKSELIAKSSVVKETNSDVKPTLNFNITANGGNATASATAKIDLSVEFKNIKDQVKNACLNEEQEKAILAKLDELEKISKEKNQRTRWQKIKGVFKWLAEEGLQVASWVVPLVYKIMSGT